jgi:RimJ/RimL family protein N-acetyltransferase
MIYANRIRLRSVEHADIPKFVAWLNDPEVIAGLAVYLPMSIADEEKWFAKLADREQAEKPLAIEMKDGDGWTLIGNSGFHDIDWKDHSAEVGIMIGEKSLWNQGYGTEAMTLLLKHGFETLNLNRVQLHVYESNQRAFRAYEKCGFVLEGTKREAIFKNGRYENVHVMSVLRSEWDARK